MYMDVWIPVKLEGDMLWVSTSVYGLRTRGGDQRTP